VIGRYHASQKFPSTIYIELTHIMPTQYGCHCNGCPYLNADHLQPHFQNMRSAPLSMEENDADVLLIFQAPGVNEWAKGKPVISTKHGSAGVRLNAAFRRVNRTRQNFNITNTVQCFPGKKSAVGVSNPRDLAPKAAAQRHCAEWLRQDIEAHKYTRIVVFGTPAAKAVRKLGFTDSKFKFIYHPAGGLKNVDLDEALDFD